MARKAGRYNAITGNAAVSDDAGAVTAVTCHTAYNVALYTRLSVEKEERKSDSIESQFMIMENFIKDKPEFSQYQKYSDRGFSGTTFTRPDFIRMMDDVKTGRINCIIVKDLSRFGRDYLATGNYIETIFPFLGVRFISVNDHFDTFEDYNGNKGLGISLMNLVNDMYARDVSRRITTAFDNCMERGSVLGQVPYGYDKIKTDNGYQLVIDEPAAEIVRWVFQMAKEGFSQRAIAYELTKARVRNPEGYKRTQLVYAGEDEPYSEWHNGTVSQMLSNEVYIGTLIQGKRKTCLYKGEKEHKVDKENWIVHENAHEPIISRELFEEVRGVIDKHKEKMNFTGREDLPTWEDKYKGILKCSVCGGNIHRESAIVHTDDGDVRRYYYRCRHRRLPMNEQNGNLYISEEILDQLLLASMQKLMAQLPPDKKKLLGILEKKAILVEKQMQAELTDLQKQKECLEYEGSLMYGQYVKGEITRKELLLANEKQKAEVEAIDKKLLQAEKDGRAFIRKKREQKKFVNNLLSVKDKTIFTAELIRSLIAEIVLSEDKQLEIKYCFSNDEGTYTDLYTVPRKTRWDAGRRRK